MRFTLDLGTDVTDLVNIPATPLFKGLLAPGLGTYIELTLSEQGVWWWGYWFVTRGLRSKPFRGRASRRLGCLCSLHEVRLSFFVERNHG